MDFGEVLKKAWQTIWKHKILWLFGILAGCGATGATGTGGGGGGGGVNIPSTPQPDTFNGFQFVRPDIQRAIEDFFRTLGQIPPWVWVLLVIMLFVIGVIMWFVFLLLGTFGIAGVIKGTSMADQALPDAKPISFNAIFKGVKPQYLKVFLLYLGWRILEFLLGIFLIIPIIILAVCTCGIFALLLIPIGWFIGLMLNFTTIAIIEEEQGIFESIGRAWRVIIRNLGNVLLMFLILGIGQLIIGLIIGLPLIIVPVPIIANLVISGVRTIAVGLILSILLLMVFMPVVIFLSGVLRAFILASWTLTYRRLTGEAMVEPTVISEVS